MRVFAAVCCIALALVGMPSAAGSEAVVLEGRSMGTDWRLTLARPPLMARDAIARGVAAELDRVDRQMSTWREDSDLMRFNRAAPGSWQTLPAEFFAVLERALELARETDGAYDPTVGALVALWGFGPAATAFEPPDAAAIAAALRHVGWWRIELDPVARRARQPGGVLLDLSSIAKGFAVDQLARWLRRHGMHDWLVEVGGELRGAGRRADGSPWHVAIERPSFVADDASAPHVIALDDEAVASSGDYRQFRSHGEATYSHHIDPRTGKPATARVAAVTVLAPTAFDADPIGTLISVLGAEAGLEYAARHNLAVLVLVHGANGISEHRSPAFAARIKP